MIDFEETYQSVVKSQFFDLSLKSMGDLEFSTRDLRNMEE